MLICFTRTLPLFLDLFSKFCGVANARVSAATPNYRYKRVVLARSVDARSVNSPQVNKFLQVYHCSGDQGSTKVIIFYAILVCLR